MLLQVLITMIGGWINRHQQQVIAYLLEENRILHATRRDLPLLILARQLVESRIIISETPSGIDRYRERRCSDRGAYRICVG